MEPTGKSCLYHMEGCPTNCEYKGLLRSYKLRWLQFWISKLQLVNKHQLVLDFLLVDQKERANEPCRGIISKLSTKKHELKMAFERLQKLTKLLDQTINSETRDKRLHFRIDTLEVHTTTIPDGDGVMVHVDAFETKREELIRPNEVLSIFHDILALGAQGDASERERLIDKLKDKDYVFRTPSIDGAKRFGERYTLARRYRIRFRYIDAPEMDQIFGDEAKARLLEIIAGRRLVIIIVGQDQHKRYVGDVYVNGNEESLQNQLLREGMVMLYDGYRKDPDLIDLVESEAFAVEHKLGLWGRKGKDGKKVTRPWIHRLRKKINEAAKKRRQDKRQKELDKELENNRRITDMFSKKPNEKEMPKITMKSNENTGKGLGFQTSITDVIHPIQKARVESKEELLKDPKSDKKRKETTNEEEKEKDKKKKSNKKPLCAVQKLITDIYRPNPK